MYPKIFSDYFRGFERSSEVFVAMPFSDEAEPRRKSWSYLRARETTLGVSSGNWW